MTTAPTKLQHLPAGTRSRSWFLRTPGPAARVTCPTRRTLPNASAAKPTTRTHLQLWVLRMVQVLQRAAAVSVPVGSLSEPLVVLLSVPLLVLAALLLALPVLVQALRLAPRLHLLCLDLPVLPQRSVPLLQLQPRSGPLLLPLLPLLDLLLSSDLLLVLPPLLLGVPRPLVLHPHLFNLLPLGLGKLQQQPLVLQVVLRLLLAALLVLQPVLPVLFRSVLPPLRCPLLVPLALELLLSVPSRSHL
mmetsp:Transcript_18576/g.26061  ORF Transcript_18576/g.26061 Transcript_18576/m.26061 type:complete len:246 (-) Transcript_18576:29-766(-)